MKERFADILTAGGKSNSLGRTAEVIEAVLDDKTRLEELYLCVLDQDAWVRMRAIDAIEKVCRQHPDWILPYIDRFIRELHASKQPSIQWHLAQIYNQVTLSSQQEQVVVTWLTQLISTKDTDWIVAANTMDTLAAFCKSGRFDRAELISVLHIQHQHKSTAVVKRADKYLQAFA